MRKFYTHLFLLTIFFVGIDSLASCSDDKPDDVETSIKFNDLPQKAQNFLDMYFMRDYTITRIDKETEGDITVFEVYLDSAYEIVFNSEGDWQQIEAYMGYTVPMEVIPQPVADTLKAQYPFYGVNEINTTGDGWKVELSNNQNGPGIDIWFNMSGEIIKTSQDNE